MRSRFFLALVLSVGSLSMMSCLRTTLEAQRSVISEVLNCPESRIKVQDFAGSTRWFRGCGQERMMTCAFLGDALRCFPMQDLKKRAAFEMSCSRDQLRLTPLDERGHVVGVTGCGKKYSYQYVRKAEAGYNWFLASTSDKTKREKRPGRDTRFR